MVFMAVFASDFPWWITRKYIDPSPTGGWRHRLSLCRPSGPGTSCEQPLLQQHTSCLPTTPAPEGRHYLMPGPTGPGVEEGKEFHPIPPVAVATGFHCVGPPGLEGTNPGLVLVCSLSGLRGHDALRKSQVLDTMRSLVQRQLHTPYRRMLGLLC